MNYKLFVRDQYLNRVAEIDDYQALDMVLRFNSAGTWALDLPFESLAAKEILKNRAGIIVERNGQVIFSGPVTGRNRKWEKDKDQVTVNGYDDSIWLSRNLAYPVPSGQPYTSQAYDIRKGPAETIIKEYVDNNIGPKARSDRRIANLVIQPDKGLGKVVTGRARFHPLMDVSMNLAVSGGNLGFRIIQVNKTLEFQVYQPVDKTRDVIFSPFFGNLLGFEYSQEDPETNYVIVGGGGEGTARIFLEREHSASISKYGRIETFVDRRDTTDTGELQQKLQEELSDKAAKTGLILSPIDTENCSFGKEYFLGDKVSVAIISGSDVIEELKDVIKEVKISVQPEGEAITPMVGRPESLSHPVFGLFNKMNKIQKRVGNLERR